MTRAAQALLVAAIVWGALAFGAVYPWAYWPMAIAAQAVALIGILTPARSLNPIGLSRLTVSFALFIAVALLQLVPLTGATLRALSPQAPALVRQFDPVYAVGLTADHPLSIHPRATLIGIAMFATFALVIVGSARVFSLRGARGTARTVAVFGVLLALIGIIQRPLYAGKIYGFWTPHEGGNPFGPFVNRNHFAGWMLMALPLTLGLICAGIARGMHGVKATLRERALWLGSADASSLLLYCAAAGIMALSLVLTMSRSGISALALTVCIVGTLAVLRESTALKRVIAIAFLCCLVIGVVWSVGLSTIVTQFQAADWSEINARKGAWSDAISIASKYPLTGTGLNTYGDATLFYQQHDLAQHYAQAHNDYLQLAAEGGLMLTVPFALCAILFILAVRRRFKEEISVTTYWIRAGAATGLCAIALQETVDFSLQMPGNALLFCVLCGIALHRTPERRRA